MDCYYRFFDVKKLSKTNLFYVNKALTIDDKIQLYWKRYATINKQLDLFEEAGGFRKAVSLVIMN
jgi:hypothetical protein